MFFAFYATLVTLVLSSLVLCSNERRCRIDACLRSFERNRDEALRYCEAHPDPMWMSPTPRWANECHSLGHNNNKRHRLASACSCLCKPRATDPTIYLAGSASSMNITIVQNTTVLATSTETDASIGLHIPSEVWMSNETAATSTLSSSGTTTIDGENETTGTI